MQMFSQPETWTQGVLHRYKESPTSEASSVTKKNSFAQGIKLHKFCLACPSWIETNVFVVTLQYTNSGRKSHNSSGVKILKE
ncbi:hypothetical protein E2C01_063708 [Portunus trituberculatus]|uniref:Uncharacterized protein n=1 Tax=Portunus trituberculatus TaxID=210409 RepID=A0A5B7H9V8_PORTR|nr:hypothetical protein [Portunus trituberculatus]